MSKKSAERRCSSRLPVSRLALVGAWIWSCSSLSPLSHPRRLVGLRVRHAPNEGCDMDQQDWLADRFEQHRSRLRAVSYRMLGSLSEADDAVQEAWLRFSRADTSAVEDLGAWLTTVVARICLNSLRSRKTRREE